MEEKLDIDEMRAEVVEHGVLDYDQAQELLSRLEQAEQAVQRVRALLPDDADIREMFVVRAVDILRALDGEQS